MKKTIIIILIFLAVGLGAYLLISQFYYNADKDGNTYKKEQIDEKQNKVGQNNEEQNKTENSKKENKAKTIIGKSVEGQDITAFHYGETKQEKTEILFVGGIHGGYSWNTALLAYKAMGYLQENESKIPSGVEVTIIPVLNPDGLKKTIGTVKKFKKSDVSSSEADMVAGRFNTNEVDLNRNFDCDWESSGKWRNQVVNGGSKAFSEPESQAIKGYVEREKLAAVVTWYSAMGGVYSSSCHNGILKETHAITNAYANASGYPAYEEFDAYEITGDMVNWLASINIPAISVLLTNHQDIEWSKNKKGIRATLEYYSE